ncbi:hypothetical protein [Paraferrimonas sp. SM1919]|uniref:hypothetical protein n=1 Tax=Paraferrimonas sp. SM1919 TaxID=2662263 RepID=UPI0013D8BBBD|nr:hypothetical protein [Paraferrimonas sp. SM1919]
MADSGLTKTLQQLGFLMQKALAEKDWLAIKGLDQQLAVTLQNLSAEQQAASDVKPLLNKIKKLHQTILATLQAEQSKLGQQLKAHKNNQNRVNAYNQVQTHARN